MAGKNNISFYFDVGENIQSRRREFGVSQVELAESTGIGLRTIQKYENNEVNPKISTLKLIASALDCSLEELLNKPKDYGQLKETASECLKLKNAINSYVKRLKKIAVDAEKLVNEIKKFSDNIEDIYGKEV